LSNNFLFIFYVMLIRLSVRERGNDERFRSKSTPRLNYVRSFCAEQKKLSVTLIRSSFQERRYVFCIRIPHWRVWHWTNDLAMNNATEIFISELFLSPSFKNFFGSLNYVTWKKIARLHTYPLIVPILYFVIITYFFPFDVLCQKKLCNIFHLLFIFVFLKPIEVLYF